MKSLALSLALGVSFLSACSSHPSVDAAASAAAAPPPQASAAKPAAPAGVQTMTGPVLETMNAATYTYVRVKTDAGDVWAASAQFAVAVGDRVVVPLETPMQNFHSQSLNRDFPIIYFASRITREGDAPAEAPPAMAASHGPTGMGAMGGQGTGAATAPVVTKMPPPDGGMSIADLWAKRASLAGKTVTVRGTVVKFNGGILGRNWIHIQDGSGAAADGTHDLTVTSDAVVKIGDVITATGTVAVDKDFTAGYAYPVILEGARLGAK